MAVIDAQLHIDADHSAEALLSMMGSVGVRAAVLTQSGKQRGDTSPIVRAAAEHPGRFALVAAVDATQPDVGDSIARWREEPNAVAIRIVLRTEEERHRFDSGGFAPLLEQSQELRMPLFTFPHAQFERWGRAAAAYPELRFVVDHFGLLQPPHADVGDAPWAGLPGLLALARHDNVAVKFTRAPSLSLQPYPFADVWPHLHAVIEAFGVERLMWGSDITEVGGLHTYREAVDYLRESGELSPDEKEQLMGGSLERLLHWTPAVSG